MQKKVNRIGVLTSGGDAPGMNAAIRAVVRTSYSLGIECIGIHRGYHGLVRGDMEPLKAGDVVGLTSRGGTVLYTARSEEFMRPEGMRRAVENCHFMGLDGLIVIGGDGTFRGAMELVHNGVPVVGIPATIDNDIGCTDYTIGFDTACNTAIDSIDKLKDTMQSHNRCSVVEVMGHNAGHIALYVAIGCGATAVIVPEAEFNMEKDVINRIRDAKLGGRTHFMIIVSEGAADINEIAAEIRKQTGIDTRVTVLGHVQRGGIPLIRDRVMASRMGYAAVKVLARGGSGRVICARNGKFTDIDIEEALKMKKGLDKDIYVILDAIMAGA